MLKFFYETPSFLLPYQQNLKSWFPSAPDDAVWGGFRNVAGSTVVTIVKTQGNAVSSLASQPIAAMATIFYTLIMTSCSFAKTQEWLKLEERQWSQVPHVASAVGIVASHFFGKQMGINSNLLWSSLVTGCLYVLFNSQSDNQKPITPLFISVVSV